MSRTPIVAHVPPRPAPCIKTCRWTHRAETHGRQGDVRRCAHGKMWAWRRDVWEEMNSGTSDRWERIYLDPCDVSTWRRARRAIRAAERKAA